MSESRPRTLSRSLARVDPLPVILAASALVLVLPTSVASSVAPPEPGWQGSGMAVEASGEELDTDRLSTSTVLITADRFDPMNTGWGSGSIISEDGLILTNAHVAANRAPGVSVLYPDIRYEPPSPRTLYVYTVDSATDRAEPEYRAEVVAVDGYLDLAVLRVVAYADGVPLEPADLDLPAVTIGSAGDLRPLDDLVVAGYPGIAETFAVRFTRGELNNFSDDPRVGRDAWLHTDAKIAAGNSGGLAVDAGGQLVAVPTQTTSDGPNGAIDYNMRPIGLALPLIEAARTGQTYDPYTHVVRPSGAERATVLGWSDEQSDACVSGGDAVPFGTAFVYAQIQFDDMQGGDHVLVQLVDLGAADPSRAVVDYTALDWPVDLGTSACLPITLGLDRSFPQGDYGPFFDGEYGVSVHVGPVDEYEATAGAYASAVRVVDDFGSLPGIENATPTPRPVTTARPHRPAPVRPDQASRRAMESALLQRATLYGFDCTPWRQGSTFDPFDDGAVGAVICEKGLGRQGVSQLALFGFPDARSMADYWAYRLRQVPGRMSRSEFACWDGTRGVTAWRHGEVACYVSTSEAGTRAARIRWTDERTNTYGLVDATDVDLPALVDWWLLHHP